MNAPIETSPLKLERPITALRPHAALRLQPQWPDEDPRFQALTENVAQNGVLEPIKITADDVIVDGRHRWRAARSAGHVTIPCSLVEESDALEIILSTILIRRHYTKGQLAYVAAPMFDQTVQSSISKRKKGFEHMPYADATVDQLAARLGVSTRLLSQARTIHATFEDHPDWRELDEPGILDADNPTGLGAVIAGFAGRLAAAQGRTSPGTGETTKQLELFNRTFDDLQHRVAYYDKFSPDLRRQAFQHIRATLDTVSVEFLEDLAITIRQTVKSRNPLQN